jgi:hypothetical protein
MWFLVLWSGISAEVIVKRLGGSMDYIFNPRNSGFLLQSSSSYIVWPDLIGPKIEPLKRDVGQHFYFQDRHAFHFNTSGLAEVRLVEMPRDFCQIDALRVIQADLNMSFRFTADRAYPEFCLISQLDPSAYFLRALITGDSQCRTTLYKQEFMGGFSESSINISMGKEIRTRAVGPFILKFTDCGMFSADIDYSVVRPTLLRLNCSVSEMATNLTHVANEVRIESCGILDEVFPRILLNVSIIFGIVCLILIFVCIYCQEIEMPPVAARDTEDDLHVTIESDQITES